MAWRAAFLAALEANARAPIYVLETVAVYEEPGKPYTIASVRGLGASAVGIGAPPGSPRVRVEGCALTPRTWATVIGAFSVGIVGGLGELCAHLTRGTVVALKCGFAGMGVEDFETIAVGQVRNVRGRAPYWTLECHDLLTALRQRLTAEYGTAGLFYNVSAATTVAMTWSGGSSDFMVYSTTNFERESSGTGAIKVSPSSGAAFYLTYTGTATGPIRFTGVNTTAVLGTVAAATAVDTPLAEVLYLSGHPLDIARKILATRAGDGSNGPFDVLPEGSGLGLSRTLIDDDDISRFRDDVMTVSSGSYVWELAVEDEVEDAYAWLTGFLAPAGMFLAVRQGQLTVRAIQDSQTAAYVSGLTITDADIAEVVSYEAFDYGHTPEYARAYVATGTGGASSTSSNLATLPARGSLSYDVSDRVWDNEAAIQADMTGRLHESASKVPERLVLRCAGLRLAQLTIGDVVDLTTTRTQSRRDGGDGWASRRAIVDSVSADWDGGTVEVGLLIYPETEDEFA